MVAELSAIGQVVTALTGLDGLPVVIVEAVVTTVYTCKFNGNLENQVPSQLIHGP
jgi:hypothetical protein